MSRRDKFLLIEEAKSEEVLPAVELKQEPIPLSPEFTPELSVPKTETPEIPKEVVKNAFAGMINTSISREWEAIDALNSAISTFIAEKPEDTSSVEILKQVVEEKTAHIGMLQKVLAMIDGKIAELVKDGEAKAEEIVAEEPKEEPKEVKKESIAKPLKESYHDDYWREYAAREISFYRDEMATEEEDEAYTLLSVLNEKQLNELIDYVADEILSEDDLWTGVTNLVRRSIKDFIEANISDNLKEIEVEDNK